MAENWEQEQLNVYNDFKEDGFPFTIRRPGSPGVFNPETLAYDGETQWTDYPSYGLQKNYPTRLLGQLMGAETIIEAGDIELIFPALHLPKISTSDLVVLPASLWPLMDDRREWDGVAKIVSLQTIMPATVILLYKAQIRVP